MYIRDVQAVEHLILRHEHSHSGLKSRPCVCHTPEENSELEP